jgi:hypothetical protein
VQAIDMILQLPAGAPEGIVDSNARQVSRFPARSLMCIKRREARQPGATALLHPYGAYN